MADAPTVDIIGLRALARDIKRAGTAPDLLIQMREAARKVADPVAAAIREALPKVDTREHSAGTLAGSVRTTATRTGSAVRMGTAAVDWAGPVDFGGWPHGRQFMPDGRYMYPIARQSGIVTSAASEYSDALQRGFNGYNWTNTSGDPGGVHD